MTARYFILCTAIMILLFACGNRSKSNTGKVDSGETAISRQIDSVQSMVFLMLSPNEILNEIFSKKTKFDPQLLNPRSNYPMYLDNKRKALNLGVYISDFAYLNLCENKSYSLDYFKIIRDLAQKNNIYGCFDESVFNRVQNNLANSDSLVAISQEMYYNMTDILDDANRQNINALISSGALVESLYLSVMNIEKLPDYNEIIQRIFEQRQLFDNFHSYISKYQTDKDVRSVLTQLDEIKKMLDKSTVSTQKTKVKKDKSNHLEVKGGQDIIASEAVFKELKESVIKTRQTFIATN